MNYQKIYNNLISKRIYSPATGYKEVHHIIPRCLGGTDDKSNLVSLSYKEHYLAHVLLCKIYPDNTDLSLAIFLFSSISGSMYEISRQRAIDFLRTREISEETKALMSRAQKDRFSKEGSKDYLIDREISEETRAKQSKSAKARFEDPEYASKVKDQLKRARDKNGPSMLGKNHTPESCEKMLNTWRSKGTPILRYDISSKELKRYEYPSDASREYGISSSNIAMCCKKNMVLSKRPPNKSLGYVWIYDTEEAFTALKFRLSNA